MFIQGMHVNGRSACPLSLKDVILYGTHRDKVEAAVLKARMKATAIENKMTSTNSLLLDATLLQHFILEQLSPLKRFIFQRLFFTFPIQSPDTIHPLPWLLSWCFIIGSLCFFLRFFLLWGLSNGGATFKNFLVLFILSIIQTGLAYLLRNSILNFVSLHSVQPQLKAIRDTLVDVAKKCVVESNPHNKEQGYVVHRNATSMDDSQCAFRVVQHFSPACRAARSTVGMSSFAGRVLGCLDDMHVERCASNKEIGMQMNTVVFVGLHFFIIEMFGKY